MNLFYYFFSDCANGSGVIVRRYRPDPPVVSHRRIFFLSSSVKDIEKTHSIINNTLLAVAILNGRISTFNEEVAANLNDPCGLPSIASQVDHLIVVINRETPQGVLD